jgi:hypothetical protein
MFTFWEVDQSLQTTGITCKNMDVLLCQRCGESCSIEEFGLYYLHGLIMLLSC